MTDKLKKYHICRQCHGHGKLLRHTRLRKLPTCLSIGVKGVEVCPLCKGSGIMLSQETTR